MKKIRREYKDPILRLLEYYRQHTDTIVNVAQHRCDGGVWSCPLCYTNDELEETCSGCPWTTMTGTSCFNHNLEEMQVTKRIVQLEEWLKHIEE